MEHTSSFPILTDGRPGTGRSHVQIDINNLSFIIHHVCRELGISVSCLLECAWALVLDRFLGNDGVRFGSIVRTRGKTQQHVLEVRLDREVHLQDLLLSGCGRGDATSTDSLSRSISSDEDSLASFNTAIIYQDNGGPMASNPELNDESQLESATDQMGMYIKCHNEAGQLQASLSFNRAVLCPPQADNVASTLLQAVQCFLVDRTQRIRDVSLLSEWNAACISKWNHERPQLVSELVNTLIEQNATEEPAAASVCAWDGELSYSKLMEYADCIATQLQRYTVQPGDFIPLCFEKSRWAIVAMVAVMKAGAAFVLLDPSQPQQRLSTIGQILKPKVMLGSEETNTLCASLLDSVLVVNEQNCQPQGCVDCSFHAVQVSPVDPLYAVFTSGSTGVPKACVITHTAYASAARSRIGRLRFTRHSRAFQYSSYAFTSCLEDILTSLIAGGCICIPSEAERHTDIAAAFNRYNANRAEFTPSTLKLLSPDQLPSLETLAVGGEGLPRDELTRWTASHIQVMNSYGSSECCATSMVQDALHPAMNPTNIGRPVGATAWIVERDDHDRLAPVGAIGELLLEGPILAAGYLHDPEKTDAVFIHAPAFYSRFRADSNPRLYKTGDLVRYTADGAMEFVGRKDSQVKLRGQRFDLHETEASMRAFLPKNMAVACELVDHPDIRSGSLLVAFLAPMPDANATRSQSVPALGSSDEGLMQGLMQHLTSALPSYMVPSTFLQISHLPITLTSKLDRMKLRQFALQLSIAELLGLNDRQKEDFASELEGLIIQLAAKAIGLDTSEVYPGDNFFRLGGNSLSAMQLVNFARDKGFYITLQAIFEAPTLRELASTIRDTTQTSFLPPAPFALLDQVVSDISDLVWFDDRNVSVQDIEDAFPCTPLQEGFMGLSMKTPGSYVSEEVMLLSESIDLDRFRQIWDEVETQLPILRTRIVAADRQLVQVVMKSLSDWETDVDLDAYLSRGSRRDIKLGDPLMRKALVSNATGKAYFVLTAHHAICDRASMDLVWNCLHSLCSSQNRLPQTIPFSHFVQGLSETDRVASETFWRQNMAGLETDSFPALPHKDYQVVTGATISKSISGSDFDSGTGITLPNLLSGAWAIVQSCYSGSRDIVFGSVLNGRDLPVPGIDNIVGPTISTVPLHLNTSPDLSIQTFLSSVQQKTTQARAHQYLGLQNISSLSPEAAAGCSFQSLMVVQPVADDELERSLTSEGFHRISSLDFAQQGGYPIMLECNLGEGGVTVVASYDDQVVHPRQMQRILDLFELVTTQLIKSPPSERIADLNITTTTDIQNISSWNDPALKAGTQCVHGIFSSQARQRGNAPAICAWDGELTYEALDELSSRLALRLIASGVGRGCIVPLCFGKSIWTMVAMLGVMKAGGAFTLLDVAHPKLRNKEIARTVGARVIVSSISNAGLSMEFAETVIVINWQEAERLPSLDQGSLPLVKASDALYVAFTSGSTGTPKGVVIEHAAFATAIQHRSWYLDESSRVLDFASYSFDATMDAMLLPLCSGGCVCVPSDYDRFNNLVGVLNRQQVNTVNLTPSVAKLLSPDEVPTVHTMLLGGEPMTREVIQKWAKSTRLVNVYGPTECCVVCAINPTVMPDTHTGNIGRASGAWLWIVDANDHTKLLPVGAVGELLIGGPLLAREYLNNPTATAGAFVNDAPWLQQFQMGPVRMYKSGDLAHYDHEGSLICVGRKDTQIKLRGQRIEPGEIQQVIREQYPAFIHEAVVDVVKGTGDANHQNSLVAFYTLVPGAVDGEIRDFQDRLSERLPRYMVPSRYVLLDQMPLTVSGKIDRKRLRQEGMQDAQSVSNGRSIGKSKEPPSTEIERALHSIWVAVLNVEASEIGIHDAFIGLGGDSITAMQVVSRCRALNIGITVLAIFKHKTIAGIAKVARPSTRTDISADEPMDTWFALSPIQRLHFTLHPEGQNHFNQSFLLRLSEQVSADAFTKAVNTVVERHTMLRARFAKQSDGQWAQKVLRDPDGAYQFAVHTVSQFEDTMPVAQQRQSSLDIGKGPVFAIDFIRVAGGASYAYCVAHHLVIDLVSWRIIFTDIEHILKHGNLQRLDDYPLPFQTWCSMQQQEVATGIIQSRPIEPSNYEYWGMKTVPNRYEDILEKKISLCQAVTEMLVTNQPGFDGELLDIMLGALLYSFSTTFTDRETPPVFNESHGRQTQDDSIDLSRTVGWFTTMYPVQAPRAQCKSLAQSIRTVHESRSSFETNSRQSFAQRLLQPPGEGIEHAQDFPPEILFNYVGRYQQFQRSDALLQWESQPLPDVHDNSGRAQRSALVDIEAGFEDGNLYFVFAYNRSMKHASSVLEWAEAVKRGLEGLSETR